MLKLEVFDPAMCCSTGICGDSQDQKLVTFASDLEWLKMQGIRVERHGLALEPDTFIKNESIKNLLCEYGNKCLPVIMFDNKMMLKGYYPSREHLAEICAIEYNDDEAPPIHREENCCCGQDCDCTPISLGEKLGCPTDKSVPVNESCDCSNSAAEDNCCCTQNVASYTDKKPSAASGLGYKLMQITFIIILLIVIGLIAVKLFDKAGAAALSEKITDSINFLSQILLSHINLS